MKDKDLQEWEEYELNKDNDVLLFYLISFLILTCLLCLFNSLIA